MAIYFDIPKDIDEVRKATREAAAGVDSRYWREVLVVYIGTRRNLLKLVIDGNIGRDYSSHIILYRAKLEPLKPETWEAQINEVIEGMLSLSPDGTGEEALAVLMRLHSKSNDSNLFHRLEAEQKDWHKMNDLKNISSITDNGQKNIIELDKKKHVFLCGAGISINSGLPSAMEILRYSFEKLNFSQNVSELIINSELPFESIIQSYKSNSDISDFLNLFKIGEPNKNHIFLAKLAKEGFINTIVTTNFDLLIERAFESEGMIRGNDYEVFYDEEQIKSINWNKKNVKIIKIHGSIEDIDSLVVTIDRVASENISLYLKNVIDYIFLEGNHEAVTILGYSCSDYFDISPLIRLIEDSNKKINFIEHVSSSELIEENISKKTNNNPFTNFQGVRYFINTDVFIDKCWKQSLSKHSDLFVSDLSLKNNWQKFILTWINKNNKIHVSFYYDILGALFIRLSLYKEAIKCFKISLNEFISKKELKGEAVVLCNLSYCMSSIGEFDQALDITKKYYEISKNIGDKVGEGDALLKLGEIYASKEDNINSLDSFKNGAKIAKSINDREGIGIGYSNMGLIYKRLGQYQEAIDSQRKALQIYIELGDIYGIVKSKGNLGAICIESGAYNLAIQYLIEAIKFSKLMGHEEGIGINLYQLGLAYDYSEKKTLAKEMYQEAIVYLNKVFGSNHNYSKLATLRLNNLVEKFQMEKNNSMFPVKWKCTNKNCENYKNNLYMIAVELESCPKCNSRVELAGGPDKIFHV